MPMSVSGSLGSVFRFRAFWESSPASPRLAQERSVGPRGGFPHWLWGCWIRRCGELALSFLPLTVEDKGESNAVSCVTVKNTR